MVDKQKEEKKQLLSTETTGIDSSWVARRLTRMAGSNNIVRQDLQIAREVSRA